MKKDDIQLDSFDELRPLLARFDMTDLLIVVAGIYAVMIIAIQAVTISMSLVSIIPAILAMFIVLALLFLYISNRLLFNYMDINGFIK